MGNDDDDKSGVPPAATNSKDKEPVDLGETGIDGRPDVDRDDTSSSLLSPEGGHHVGENETVAGRTPHQISPAVDQISVKDSTDEPGNLKESLQLASPAIIARKIDAAYDKNSKIAKQPNDDNEKPSREPTAGNPFSSSKSKSKETGPQQRSLTSDISLDSSLRFCDDPQHLREINSEYQNTTSHPDPHPHQQEDQSDATQNPTIQVNAPITPNHVTIISGADEASVLVAEPAVTGEERLEELRREYRERMATEMQQRLTISDTVIAQVVPNSPPDNNRPRQPRRLCMLVIAAFSVLVLAVAAGLAIILLRKDDGAEDGATSTAGQNPNQSPDITNNRTIATDPPVATNRPSSSQPPSAAPTFFSIGITPRFIELLEILQPILAGAPTFTDANELTDRSSIPYLVLDWMANNDLQTFIVLDDQSIPATDRHRVMLERYCVAVMFHKLNGYEWTNQFDFLSDVSICAWNDRGLFGIVCFERSVEGIFLGDNNLVGPSIPDEIYHLKDLRALQLFENWISGTISPSIANFKDLEVLWIDTGLISGVIPTEIGQLVKLRTMTIYQSKLSGTIPTEIGMLPELLFLFLFENDLTGTLPTELGQLTQLETLHFAVNPLVGTIPTEFGQLQQIFELYLFQALLCGAIPAEIGLLTNLVVVSLYENGLTGPIPTEIGKLNNLITLYIDTNELNGTIPSELGQLTKLQDAALYANLFTGMLPIEISSLTELLSFEITYTQITGNLDPIFCTDKFGASALEFVSADCLRMPSFDAQLAPVVCSCCAICCDIDFRTPCETQAPQPGACTRANCVACDNNVFAPSCGECPFLDEQGDVIAADSANANATATIEAGLLQLCFGACSWNITSSSCEPRTVFGL